MQTKTVPLGSEEINSLKAELRNYYKTSITISVFLIGLIHCIIYLKYHQWTVPIHGGLFTLLMLIIPMSVISALTRPLRAEIGYGTKTIELFIIEKKFKYDDKQDKNSSDYTKYVLESEGIKFMVSNNEYDAAEILDILVVSKWPLRKIPLTTEIIKAKKDF